MRCLCIIIAVATLVVTGICMPQVVAGDFESTLGLAWQPFGDGVDAERFVAPGWQRHASTFSSGRYSSLRLYLRIQTGTGQVCFDNAAIGDLELVNPGFEEAEGDRITGWSQDNVGETISVSDDGALDGEQCVCMAHEHSGISRIWQDVACEPDTDYEASVWIRTEGFRGDAYAEIYGMEGDEHGAIIWQSVWLSGAEWEGLSERALALRADGDADGGVQQAVELPPGQNLVLWADIAAPVLEVGQVNLSVSVEGAPLGDVSLTDPRGLWGRFSTIFQSPDDERKATVRVQVTGGPAVAYVDNVTIASVDAAIPAAEAESVGAERNLPLGGPLFAQVTGGRTGVARRGLEILAHRLDDATDGRVALVEGRGQPQITVTVEPAEAADQWWRPESYTLRCSKAGVHITAPTDEGAMYGLMAVFDLLDRTPDDHWQLIAAELTDRPAMPFRGTYMAGLPVNRAQRIAWCERLAGLRINAIVIEDDIWWHLDDPDRRRAAQEAFADFRAYGIDPIPELQSFGWAHIILGLSPEAAMCAEGEWVEREPLVLRDEDEVRLAHSNVLRTETTDIVIRDSEGEPYREGRDYVVVNGVTEHVYRPEAEPYRVRRVAGGRIPDGATVYARYDYVARVNSQNCPYCPSEPRVSEIMTAAMRDTVRYLAPTTMHIGHDEPAVMNADSRCRARGLTNAELMAEDVQRLYDAAHEVDPSVRIMMWADAVNPYHNGLQFADDPTADALALLPKDVVLNVWFYGPGQPIQQGADSLRYLASQGFATTGSPWYDETCATRWAQVCHAARRQGDECLGVLYTSWAGRWDALDTCARAAWRPPTTGTEVTAAGE